MVQGPNARPIARPIATPTFGFGFRSPVPEHGTGKSREPVHPPQYCYGGRAAKNVCATFFDVRIYLFMFIRGSFGYLAFSIVMKITDVLRAEHAVFHNLFDHIEATVPR